MRMPAVQRIFFVAFYLFGVLICLNLVVAFAIDAFMSYAEENQQQRGGAPGEGDAPPAVAPLRIDTTGDGLANAVAYDTTGDGRFDTIGVMPGARAAPSGGGGDGASAAATQAADDEKATAERVRAAVAPADNGVGR